MNQQLQEAVFAAACDHHRELLAAMPEGTEKDSYIEGLSDGVSFILNR
jgi:hypothetical protein